jgi:hypothetical protein
MWIRTTPRLSGYRHVPVALGRTATDHEFGLSHSLHLTLVIRSCKASFLEELSGEMVGHALHQSSVTPLPPSHRPDTTLTIVRSA